MIYPSVPENKFLKCLEFSPELFVCSNHSLYFTICLRMLDPFQNVVLFHFFAELLKGMIGISLEIQCICKELASMIGNYLPDLGNMFVGLICILKQLDGQFCLLLPWKILLLRGSFCLHNLAPHTPVCRCMPLYLLVYQSIWAAERLSSRS